MGLLGDAWDYIVAYVIDLVHPYQYVVACCLLIPTIWLLFEALNFAYQATFN